MFSVLLLSLAVSIMLLGIYLKVHVYCVALVSMDTPRMVKFAGTDSQTFVLSAANLLSLLKK